MFVPTRSSSLKDKSGDSFETVVFQSKKNAKQKPEKTESFNVTVPKQNKKEDNMELKKLRYEVIKFGTSGFHGEKKEESRVALAVSLGAKPPPKKYKNYVDILAERKAKKENGEKIIKQNQKRLSGRGMSRRKGKGTGELLNSYGKVRTKHSV